MTQGETVVMESAVGIEELRKMIEAGSMVINIELEVGALDISIPVEMIFHIMDDSPSV